MKTEDARRIHPQRTAAAWRVNAPDQTPERSVALPMQGNTKSDRSATDFGNGFRSMHRDRDKHATRVRYDSQSHPVSFWNPDEMNRAHLSATGTVSRARQLFLSLVLSAAFGLNGCVMSPVTGLVCPPGTHPGPYGHHCFAN